MGAAVSVSDKKNKPGLNCAQVQGPDGRGQKRKKSTQRSDQPTRKTRISARSNAITQNNIPEVSTKINKIKSNCSQLSKEKVDQSKFNTEASISNHSEAIKFYPVFSSMKQNENGINTKANLSCPNPGSRSGGDGRGPERKIIKAKKRQTKQSRNNGQGPLQEVGLRQTKILAHFLSPISSSTETSRVGGK